jgi:uncharacterized protein (DUF2236 family)
MANDEGYFGPSSAMWRLNREAVLGVGLGRALLLQLAHPWVAQAVVDHSTFKERPVDRLVGTVVTAELLVFGSRAQANTAAARLNGLHRHVTGHLDESVGRWPKGTQYRAGDPDAQLWVLATLLDTTLLVYEACFGRIPEDTVRTYLHEAARLGALLGVPAHSVPEDRNALQLYMRSMVSTGTVAVSRNARVVASALLNPRNSALNGLAWLPYTAATRGVAATTLPPVVRRQYGSTLDVRALPLYRLAGWVGRRIVPRLPASLRLDPIAAVAINRAARYR